MRTTTVPGALLYTRPNGTPVHLIAGGSEEETATEQTDTTEQDVTPDETPDTTASDKPAKAKASKTDLASLPDDIQQMIANLRGEAAKHRTGKTAAEESTAAERAKLAKVLQALGINADGSDDTSPEQVAALLEEAQTAAWQRGVKLQVFTLADKHGANASALLDSMSFINSLDDLVDGDPDSSDFATQLEAKIKAAVKDNPAKFGRDQPKPAPKKSGAEGMNGGIPAGPRSTSLTAAVSNAIGHPT